MNKQMICATVIRRKRNKPKAYVFDTPVQGFVEEAMIDLGYDATQYVLSFVVVSKPPENPCDECGQEAGSKGLNCPDGAFICRRCFDAGLH